DRTEAELVSEVEEHAHERIAGIAFLPGIDVLRPDQLAADLQPPLGEGAFLLRGLRVAGFRPGRLRAGGGRGPGRPGRRLPRRLRATLPVDLLEHPLRRKEGI